MPGVRLISQQTYHGVDQIAPLLGRLRLLDLREERDGNGEPFRDIAARRRLRDVMVTSDSAPVHLGGPTWLALSAVAEWHWIAGREDSPWYPTVRVFRQAGLNDWDGIYRRMARELTEMT